MPPTSPARDGRPHVVRVYSRLELGGIEHQMLEILPRLNSGPYRVSLCLLKREGELAERLRGRGIEVSVVPFKGRLNPVSVTGLARVFRRVGATIVHAHVRESNTSATVAARLARVPVVIGSIHSVNTIRGWRRILQDRMVAKLRDATVAVSESVRRNYCATVGVDPSRVTVIYNGVDLARFAGPPVDRERILAALGVPSGDRVVVCVGRLVAPKAHETLLAAAARVIGRAPRTTFLLVGEGDRLADLRREATRLGVGPKVIFAGKRTNVPEILRASDVSTLTSVREGFSNVVIESLAAGLPVVATDVGGNAEAVEEGISGFLVRSGDVDGLADRFVRLVTDDALRARMSEAARLRARRFSLDETVKATEALYDSLLAGRGGAATPRA